ncbi:MAG: dipeptidase PepE [Fermentimonas sp.]|jgi:dipeptidase E|nr:dipeptidase PepE [Fermentimonas sp.]NLC85640.1 dipeptidase PepE [Bacteroidales bacterium]HBT84423.1 dipeptidase PepE [Porphyromonadaceae bacterium]MDD2931703.1 dipeptidase PepE [Fermentimonas sp.]MDD3188943.1 dipeptidase PepE [Fermentimonas sp.]
MRLLLISNSTNPGEGYLEYPKQHIKDFLGEKATNAIFIPYAAVTFSFEEYEKKVNERFAEIGHHVTSIHRFINPVDAIENADAIVVGGGNTWQLVKMLQEKGLMKVIRKRVKKGTPYIGWSAGSNIACPTLKTTNDMPIMEPIKFKTLKLVPFQINPHYLDDNPANHGGETREDRIKEFIEVNKETYVVGLREGTMLLLDDDDLILLGNRKARIFKYGQEPKELTNEEDFNFLLQRS